MNQSETAVKDIVGITDSSVQRGISHVDYSVKTNMDRFFIRLQGLMTKIREEFPVRSTDLVETSENLVQLCKGMISWVNTLPEYPLQKVFKKL